MIGLILIGIIIYSIISKVRRKNSPECRRVIEILNTRYAKGEERYACGDLSAEEFINMPDEILNSKQKGNQSKPAKLNLKIL